MTDVETDAEIVFAELWLGSHDTEPVEAFARILAELAQVREERDEANAAWRAGNARLDELTRIDLVGTNHGELETLRAELAQVKTERDALRPLHDFCEANTCNVQALDRGTE